MSFKSNKLVISVFAVIAVSASLAGAQQQDSKSKVIDKGQPVEEKSVQGMDADMMAKMKEYSTPNENHKLLNQFVGSWTYAMKWWMAPEGKADESTGTSEVKSIMGGRFIEQSVSGTSMNQPFEGRGIVGFDNLKKEFTSVWFDDMATGMMISGGQYDPATKTISEKGSMSCPITNGPRSYRTLIKLVDDNTHVYEMYMDDEKGKEFKTMEITYTRKK